MAEVTSTCGNVGNTSKWFSQPNMTGTKIPAGNFLLSFGILVAGTSATKVLRLFHHMGLKCIALSTYFAHQCVSLLMILNNLLHELLDLDTYIFFYLQEYLIPGILIHLKKYQLVLIDKIGEHGDS